MQDGQMVEGYICPNCLQTFPQPEILLQHFESVHSGQTDVLKTLQDLFKKIKNSLDDSSSDSSISDAAPNKKCSLEFYEKQWPVQVIGASRNYTQRFKVLRDDRFERFSHEINKLIIRLDKLLTNMPLDPVKKKQHEQSIVPWLDGKDVSRCPNCTRSFNMVTKRQHHCRLCGCVMCNDCSFFLPLNKAKQILVDPDPDNPELNSNDNSDLKLRVCSYCLQLLESREQLKESRNARPVLCDLYESLMSKKHEASKLSAMYLEMVDSLLAGETTYYASDAQSLRVKLGRLTGDIDTISKRIANAPPTLNDSTASSVPNLMSQRLHDSIRRSCTHFICTNLMSLPNIPSDERLAQLREQKRLAEEQRQRDEAVRELKLRQKEEMNVETYHGRHSVTKENSVALLEAWTPAGTNTVSSDDPLVQQISNIKQFIKEARMSHRYNEVASLESNLKELQEEYFRRRQEQPHDNETSS